MISTNATIGTKRCILVVAQQIELRARIGRMLHSAGYGVELAESQKRALELTAGGARLTWPGTRVLMVAAGKCS